MRVLAAEARLLGARPRGLLLSLGTPAKSSFTLQVEPMLHSLGLSRGEQHALFLSFLAGASTSIGGVIAILQKPGTALLAFLLGVAIGVMVTLSVVEMWIRSALEHGASGVTLAVAGGALLYVLAQPFLPDFEPDDQGKKGQEEGEALELKKETAAVGTPRSPPGPENPSGKPLQRLVSGTEAPEGTPPGGGSSGSSSTAAPASTEAKQRPSSAAALERTPDRGHGAPAGGERRSSRSSELLRLGLVMALAMTLHNLPEGFAVAFASFTDFGGVMALGIAVHNIPEGVIVAAPVYAATGSRTKAVAIAAASGLSEPVGALAALLFVKPFIQESFLEYVLAFAGGVMLAVCARELWPEARKCQSDHSMWQGIVLGTLVMAWTLYIGV